MHKTVSFRTDSRKVEALDALAEAQDRDRTYLLNEAIDHYLDLQAYHIREVEAGIREADAGDLVDHSEVEKMIEALCRRK